MRRDIIQIFALFLGLVLLMSCRDNVVIIDELSQGNSLGKVSLNFANPPDDVVSVVAILRREGFQDHTLTLTISDTSRSASGTFENVPIGVWHLRVNALDASDVIRYTGETRVEVRPGQSTIVTLELHPASGSIEIYVTWGGICINPPSDIVSWWSGDGNANDIMNGNNGILMNGVEFVQGKVGRAFRFNGFDQYVDIPYNENYNFAPSGQFSIEAWVKDLPSQYPPNYYNRFQALIVKAQPNTMWDWGVYIDTSRRFMSGFSWNHILLSKTIVENLKWYHVAVTYNDGYWALYVNGRLEADTSGMFITQSMGSIALGRKGASETFTDYYSGLLDEVTLYSRALTSEEIRAIYMAGSAGKCKLEK